MLSGRQWFSEKYSVLDPYGFVFYVWGARRELPMAELKNYTAFKERMLERPAVRRVLEDEKSASERRRRASSASRASFRNGETLPYQSGRSVLD
jgi:glutathione S-transferase